MRGAAGSSLAPLQLGEDAGAAQRRRQAVATEAAALRRARSERAAREAGTTAIVPQPAALRTTA
ncbi:hypothetical protein ACUN29_41570 (plasmid) [Streptomyces sp. WC2508]|uniref:hypothetical protein n=1 Tax=Streptomyces sp. WC2508 TaxID=3461405 RepID=UPI004043E512